MIDKTHQFKRTQSHIRNEPAEPRKPVLTPSQKQVIAQELAEQVAQHIANGGAVVAASHGETAGKDGQSPFKILTRAQKQQRGIPL